MPVPSQCQPIADQIEQLQGEREDVTGLAGAEKWAALQNNARIAREIVKQRARLEQCVLAHAPGYETEVIIYDLAGSVATPAEGRMWSITPPSTAAVIESHPVQGGRISFVHVGAIAGKSIGISIHDAPNPTFTGPLFRSGPFASLPPGSPGDPAGLIEIGVPPAVSIPLATLRAGLPTPGSIAVGSGVTVTSILATLGTGSATLAVGASMAISLRIFGTFTVSFTYTVSFTLSPSFNMNDVSEVCLLTPTGPAALTIPAGGVLNAIIAGMAPIFEPALTRTVLSSVQTALNTTILATAAGALNVPALPAGVVLSLRRVVITPAGVALFAAVGAYGGLLNKITLP
jgi:hypothetical protein